MEPITVYLQGQPVGLRQGARVWMLEAHLEPPDQALMKAEQAWFCDAAGHELGSQGALVDGQRVFVCYR
ncbi:MAG: hypothetical protein VKP62_01050 [Candidatus Sericytochromatia bacterium]|nr:hypothetical protein [Candidatus Sericytochromatia bacterium]